MLVQRDLTASPYSEQSWTGREVWCSTMELLIRSRWEENHILIESPWTPKLDAKKTNYSFASTSLPPAARAWAYKPDPATGHSPLGPKPGAGAALSRAVVHALCSHHFPSLVLQPFWQFCPIQCSKFSALTELFCCLQWRSLTATRVFSKRRRNTEKLLFKNRLTWVKS